LLGLIARVAVETVKFAQLVTFVSRLLQILSFVLQASTVSKDKQSAKHALLDSSANKVQ
jgi:hypothetical protein